MSKKARRFVIVVVSISLLVLITLGVLSAFFNCFEINSDLKFYRDAIVSISVFSIGLFAVLFQINTKDIYGHSLKQESHFELIYIKRLVEAVSNDNNHCKRGLPNRMLLPYIIYAIAIPVSTGLCMINQKSEGSAPTGFYMTSAHIMYFSLLVVIGITVGYMVYVLKVMYSYDWIENFTQSICGDVAKLSDEDKKSKGIILAADSLRILSRNENSSSCDIVRIHSEKLVGMLKGEPRSRSYAAVKPYMVYYSELIVSCCVAGAGKINSFNDLIECLKNDDANGKGSETPADTRALIRNWMNALKESNRIPQEYWVIAVLFARKEIGFIKSSIEKRNTDVKQNRDLLLFYNQIYKYLESLFGTANRQLYLLDKKYVLDDSAVTIEKIKSEHSPMDIKNICAFADDYFANTRMHGLTANTKKE